VTTRWLLELPQLTELVLNINNDRILRQLSCCLSKIRNLRKLTLTFGSTRGLRSRPVSVDEFGEAIAGNATLTHLDLFEEYGLNLYCSAIASVSNNLQPDSPLNLQHLGVYEDFGVTPAVIPHIRLLKSFHQTICSSHDPNLTAFPLLLKEQIFPPVITTECRGECIDGPFIEYIMRHPGVTHLSDHQKGHCKIKPGPCMMLNLLSQRHSQTLEYFCTFGKSLCAKLECTENELSLLRCGRLRQLVLYYSSIFHLQPRPEQLQKVVSTVFLTSVSSG
jgi:hypothetical protein